MKQSSYLHTRTIWQVRQAERALKGLEHGDFFEASLLADAMTRDDRIASALETRVNALTGLPVRVEAAKVPNQQLAKRAAKALEAIWKEIIPKQLLTEIFYSLLKVGTQPIEIIWNTETWVPIVRLWDTQLLRFNHAIDDYELTMPDGAMPMPISSNSALRLLAISSHRPWMMSMVRALAVPYLVRRFAVQDWARYSEVHGNPIPKATLPPGDEKDAARRAFKTQVANLGARTALYAPTGQTKDDPSYDFELVEAMGKSTEAFDRLHAVMSTNIAVRVLGQNMTTEASSNQNGVSGAKQVRQDYLEADSELLGDLIRENILKPWAALHFGSVDLAPYLWWDPTPPEDKASKATSLNVLADAVTKLQALGVKIQPVLEEYGLEVVAAPVPASATQQPPQSKPANPPAQNIMNASADGFENGQRYADDLVAQALELGLLEGDLESVLNAVQASESYTDLEAKLLSVFGEMDPKALGEKIAQALTLAQLAGQAAVLEGV